MLAWLEGVTPVQQGGLGVFIRARRKELGISSQTKLAELAELDDKGQRYISRIERGENVLSPLPPPDVLAGIARSLRVTEADLLREAGYLQDDVAMRRMDDRGNEWMEEQDRLASALGVEGLERVLERVRQEYIEEMSRESGTGRQMTFS